MPAPLLHTASVRDIARFTTRAGGLGGAWRSATRGWEGIRAHQRLLEQRPEGYLREKSVKAEFPFPDFTLRVEGRVDGCQTLSDEWLVEEVKSTRLDLDFPHPDQATHRSQALLYAGLLQRETPLARCRVRLLYVHLDTAAERVVEETRSAAEILAWLDRAIEDYAGWFARVLEWHQDARVAARQAAWPFPAWRRGQRELTALVERALQAESCALAEAPTGLGKTAAMLFAAAQALAARKVEKVFYLTARNSGKLSAREALNRLRAHGFKIKSVELTAKEKTCNLAGTPCNIALCPGAAGYYERQRGALEDAFDTVDDWSPSAVREIALRHQLCPYELSLDLADWADVIVCDYNHAFDPQAHLRRFFGDERRDLLLLVDEAHNLPARARDMYSPVWDGRFWNPAANILALEVPLLARELRAFDRRLYDIMAVHATPARPQIALPEPPPEFIAGLRRLAGLAEGWLARDTPSTCRPQVLRLYRDCNSLLQAVDRLDERHQFLLEPVDEELRARIFCRDPSRLLAKTLAKARATVFFSATLRPLDAFREQLGLDPLGSVALALDSPFPPENLAVTLDTSVNTTFRNRAANNALLARKIRAFLDAAPGNHLVFFPSFAFLKEVAAHFELDVNFGRVILQRPGMREAERDAYLARFARDNPGGLAGFAVLGGVFGEGVDLPGERLKGVVVIGAGLPQVCMEQELIRAWFDEQGRPGFDYAYTYPGLSRVLQAVGRVIRTEEDTGRALLIDHRYATPKYLDLFPSHWQIPRPGGGEDGEGPIQWME